MNRIVNILFYVFNLILFIVFGYIINLFFFHKKEVINLSGYYDKCVYITCYGECYHNEFCSYIDNKIKIGLKEAINKGYRKCKHCNGLSNGYIYIENTQYVLEINEYFVSYIISFMLIMGLYFM